MPGIIDRVYAVCPPWLQNVGMSGYGFMWRWRRFGGRFSQYRDEFAARGNYGPAEWHAYQTEVLRRLLTHAARTVPHYADLLGPAAARAAHWDAFGLGDLASLPSLEKEIVRRDPWRVVSNEASRHRLHTYHSSGTTGTPIAFKFSTDSHRRWSAAYEARVRAWAGLTHRMSRAMIGGRVVVPSGDGPPFWRYNLAERQLYMSAFHISAPNAREYAKALRHHRPEYLVGYASSHYFLARAIIEQGLEVPRPRAVLTSSEKLTTEMRATIERAHGCPVFDAYSGVEACCLASECEHHRLHVSPDVGIVELLDERGEPVPPGVPGQIVATGLLNFDQPLIRYKTGDWAVLATDACSCGRAMPVLEELLGRLEDLVIGPDGREMVRFHGIFVGLPHVREGQVIQEARTRFRVRLVVESGFGVDERQTICQRFHDRLGRVTVDVEVAEHIERTERGKFRAVISHVKRDGARAVPPQ